MALMLCLSGCWWCKGDNYVVVNDYRQTNYPNSQCYDGTKTFSQIIVCLQEVDAKEKAQNLKSIVSDRRQVPHKNGA